MNLCPKVLPPRRILTVLCVFVAPFLARAEFIQFSKPVVPIAAPAKKKEQLSRDRSKGVDFNEPAMEQPFVSQPQVVRIRPRAPQEDDERERSDPRDPRESTDPTEKYIRQDKAQKSLTRQKTGPNQSRSSETPGSKRLDDFQSDGSQSLSPVTDFNLNEREPGKRSSDPLLTSRSSTNRSDMRGRSLLPTREDSEQQTDKFKPVAFFDVLAARTKEKEKPTREVLEQRAAFEQLINPNAGVAAKTPGSFEPVTSLDPIKPAIPVKMPAIIGGKVDAKPAEPMQPFGFQQTRLNPPMLQDINKNSTKLAPALGPSIDPYQQTPLNRQPSVHEFPARKF